MEDVEVRGSCTTALVNQFTQDSHQEVEEDFKALLMTEQCVPENRFINIACTEREVTKSENSAARTRSKRWQLRSRGPLKQAQTVGWNELQGDRGVKEMEEN